MIRVIFIENLNACLVFAGFVALEVGMMERWSGAIASIVGGMVLMVIGSWRYLVGTWPRKRP